VLTHIGPRPTRQLNAEDRQSPKSPRTTANESIAGWDVVPKISSMDEARLSPRVKRSAQLN
jgi:hypothetical protein